MMSEQILQRYTNFILDDLEYFMEVSVLSVAFIAFSDISDRIESFLSKSSGGEHEIDDNLDFFFLLLVNDFFLR